MPNWESNLGKWRPYVDVMDEYEYMLITCFLYRNILYFPRVRSLSMQTCRIIKWGLNQFKLIYCHVLNLYNWLFHCNVIKWDYILKKNLSKTKTMIVKWIRLAGLASLPKLNVIRQVFKVLWDRFYDWPGSRRYFKWRARQRI